MKSDFKEIEGIDCYDPDLALSNTDYDPANYENLVKYEESNFWFRSRNRVIQSLIRTFGELHERKKLLEIGCGTGYVLRGLQHFEKLELEGSEIYLQGLKYARKRLPEVKFCQLNAVNLPFVNKYHFIGAFDVLEHIEEDSTAIKSVYRSLHAGGLFFITVPQFPFMWSYLDEIACHKRRYTRKELHFKLEEAGFQIIYSTSFVFALFPLMFVSRLFKGSKISKDKKREIEAYEMKLPTWINSLFEEILKIDEFFIRRKVDLPFGGSLVVVARKKS